MRLEESVKPYAVWRFVVRDAKTGEVVQEFERKNVLTTTFKNFLAQAWADGKFQYYDADAKQYFRYQWFVVLGTGSGTPAATDTGLFNAVPSTAKTGTLSYSNNTVQYYVRYLPEDANGYSYTEAGIYDHCTNNDYTTGQLINHLTIDPPITKDNTKLVDIYITITFP